jgi:ABC-type transport system involved in cytochrome c biogenesis permease subunit
MSTALLKKILAPVASLKLAIVLLSMAILLIYAGTWAQVDTGIWTVQKKYFHSFWLWIDLATMFPRPQPGQTKIPGGFPFPGGYTLGGLMLLNLLAAHIVRFKFTLKRTGVIMIHLGLVLLIVGELLTSLLAQESQMIIDEGATATFSQDTRYGELVVIDPSKSTDTDMVVSFPQSMLKSGTTIHHDLVPFDITIDDYFPNSQILGPMQAPPGSVAEATAGIGKGIVVAPEAQVSGTEASQSDMASAYVTLTANGRELGKYLLSYFFKGPQEVRVGDKAFLIALRFQRHYKPYFMTLLKFSHDLYPGTNMARNFSSQVRLIDPANGVDRPVLIRMNEPLRYAGETYYQASFLPGDKTTILQVVHNPAWTMPYIACVIGGLGMLVHFGIMLVTSIVKRAERRENVVAQARELARIRPDEYSLPEDVPLSIAARIAPFIAGALALVLIGSMYWQATAPLEPGQIDYRSFGNLPVNFDGRVMPFDSLARTSLQVLMGRESTKLGSESVPPDQWSKIPYSDWKSVPAIRWLADALGGSDKTENYRVFRIDNPELLGLLGLDQDRSPRLYTFHEVVAQGQKLNEQMVRVSQTADNKRGLFERKVAELAQHLELFTRISQLDSLYLVPPLSSTEEWQPIGKFFPTDKNMTPPRTLASDLLLNLLVDYHENNPQDFNTHLAQYHSLLQEKIPAQLQRAGYEAFFNRFDPFLQAEILYVLIFTLGCLSWLGWAQPLGRAAFTLLLFSLALHTFGLGSRIYVSGRPPVTNLYSSAVFIAWAGIVFAVGLELYFRNVIAMVSASAMGFLSLLIAHHLAGDGDTMKQVQAVLDTNVWLATHVVCITLGYSATFLAGVLAVAYVLLGVFTPVLTEPKPGRLDEDSPARLLPRMVYAILCFAILFSFVGTVLGGIWADQSWGRFWGWDPKENGAVLIVLWNALILHARWSGIAKRRGVMLLAVFGNVITSWSWFGTNMLGVGLHSYGFMDSALTWLLVFVISQLLIIAVGNIPLRFWRSFREAPAEPPVAATSATAMAAW